MIFPLDHEPAHIHVTGTGRAKIQLVGADGEAQVLTATGIKPADLRRIMEEVNLQQEMLLAKWRRIHGPKT